MRQARRPFTINSLALVAAGAALAATLGGCASRSAAAGSSGAGGGGSATSPGTSSTTSAGAPPATSSSSAASSSASSVGTSAGTSSSAPSSAPSTDPGRGTPCKPGDVAISIGHAGVASGHLGAVLLFTNHGSHTCEISGYPQVRAARGLTVAIKQTPAGYIGGLASPSGVPPKVELTPGQSGSAVVEGTDNPVPSTAHCPAPAGALDLWLPGSAGAGSPTEISNPAGTCSAIEIHPVVSGSTGRQGQ